MSCNRQRYINAIVCFHSPNLCFQALSCYATMVTCLAQTFGFFQEFILCRTHYLLINCIRAFKGAIVFHAPSNDQVLFCLY